jgi:predicted MFS family arabinose efflux permease
VRITTSTRAALGWLYVGVMLGSLGSGLAFPYLVPYLHFARHRPLVEVGAVLGLGSLCALGTSALVGVLARRLWLPGVLAGSLAASGVGLAVLSVATTLPRAALAVVAIDVGQAAFWVSQETIVGSLVEGRRLDHVFARVFLAINVGVGAAAALGGLVVGRGSLLRYQELQWVGAVVEILGAVVVVAGVHTARSPRASRSGGVGYVALLRTNRPLRWFILLSLGLLLAGYAQLEGGWNAFSVVEVGVHPNILGFALALNTLVIVVLQVPVSRLAASWRRSSTLVGATVAWLAAWCCSAAALAFREQRTVADGLLLATMGIFALGETLYSPVQPAVVNALASDEERGHANALSSSLWSLTTIVASPLAAWAIAVGPRWGWIGGVLVATALLVVVQRRLLPRLLPPEVDAPAPLRRASAADGS